MGGVQAPPSTRLTYAVFIEARADKALGKLPRKVQDRLDQAIDALAENHKPPGSRKLSGREGYRMRVGDYRVLYNVDDAEMTVTVTRVGHRGSIYG